MLETPATLNLALAPGDSVVALNNGRDLAVADLLEIDTERMVIDQVVSQNNYHLAEPVTQAHAINALVYQLPNPYNQAQLNTGFIDPESRGWFQVGGVWVHGQGLPEVPDNFLADALAKRTGAAQQPAAAG